MSFCKRSRTFVRTASLNEVCTVASLAIASVISSAVNDSAAAVVDARGPTVCMALCTLRATSELISVGGLLFCIRFLSVADMPNKYRSENGV